MSEVAENHKQIDGLHFELASSAADEDIQSDVFKLVLSSSFGEAATRISADMTAMMKKADSATAELNAIEDLVREKIDMELIVEERNSCLRSSEKAKKAAHHKLGRRFWKKLIYTVTIAAATAVASFFW